jgi:hypothetical protein
MGAERSCENRSRRRLDFFELRARAGTQERHDRALLRDFGLKLAANLSLGVNVETSA